MEKYQDGWKDRKEVKIPPGKKNGFGEEILIREKILPKMQEENGVQERKKERAQKAFVIRIKTGEKVEVKKSPFVMGKSSHTDYTIQGNRAISRQHAYILWEKGGYFLKDLNSLNHTFLDGKKIQEPMSLEDGIFFYLADEKFQFRIE